MQFDYLVAIAERHYPDLIPILQEARLFIFPGRSHEVLSQEITEEEIEFLRDQFFLPYPVVAIEDTASCIILMDKTNNVIGSHHKRAFIECMQLNVDPDEFNDPNKDEIRQYLKDANASKDTCVISGGNISNFEPTSKSKFRYEGAVAFAMMANKEKMIVEPGEIGVGKEGKAVLRNVAIAMQEVTFFNNPTRFILEKKPAKMKKGRKTRVKRSHERPVYTFLTPTEIRTKLQLPNPANSTGPKIPHERRRHFRTFRHERFKEMRNRTIVIPASWIGRSEALQGKHIYKVMLDL